MKTSLLSDRDRARLPEFEARAADWRNGAVVYQVMVDRFVPPADVRAKRSLYPKPARLRPWSDTPARGAYLEDHQVWRHEMDFWGGDLASLRTRLDYLQDLGVDVLYLNPIFESLTNHKYDAWDYHRVDPALGTREDLKALADDLHGRGMRLVLDGVFNHLGRRSPLFRRALEDPTGPWREFFRFHPEDPDRPIGWMDVDNLPELNLESPRVQEYLWGRPDSVVQSYLRQEGIDGWRLDVAFDLGFTLLADLTRAAHEARPGSAVIGEIWNYPEEWHPAVDGVMNMHGRTLLLRLLEGRLPGPLASEMWQTCVDEAGHDHLLKAWLVLDNHDTPRLSHLLPEAWQARMARILQFTLPGTVCLYYGSEVGMEGGEEPECRAPMRWDLVEEGGSLLRLHRKLLTLRREEPALRWGDFRRLASSRLFAFLRRTLSARETVVVLANPSDEEVTDFLQLRDSKLQDVTPLDDVFSSRTFTVHAGCAEVTVPPREVLVLKPRTAATEGGYDRYNRLP